MKEHYQRKIAKNVRYIRVIDIYGKYHSSLYCRKDLIEKQDKE